MAVGGGDGCALRKADTVVAMEAAVEGRMGTKSLTLLETSPTVVTVQTLRQPENDTTKICQFYDHWH